MNLLLKALKLDEDQEILMTSIRPSWPIGKAHEVMSALTLMHCGTKHSDDLRRTELANITMSPHEKPSTLISKIAKVNLKYTNELSPLEETEKVRVVKKVYKNHLSLLISLETTHRTVTPNTPVTARKLLDALDRLLQKQWRIEKATHLIRKHQYRLYTTL